MLSQLTSRANLIGALRSFVFAFIAIEPVSALTDAASGNQVLDVHALRAAGVAGVVALVTFAWRVLVDPVAPASTKL